MLPRLPSPYGIGDLGSSAFSWIDRLHGAGQRWWQVAAARSDGLRKFSLSADFVVCGKSLLLISPDSLISDGLLQD